MRKSSAFRVGALGLGMGFLYLPILVLVLGSFNASSDAVAWGGWSTRWYAQLRGDALLREAAMVSVRLALAAASAATLVGTLAALALARLGPFRGKAVFGVALYAPLVMPEIVIGLSLLVLFAAFITERGFWTAAIAHTAMTTGLVAIVVQARLVALGQSLDEAAMDLGASPLGAFAAITLPLLLPAIAAGWLAAFALSFGDLVIASFTTGASAITLPMRVFAEARLGVRPQLDALCTVMMAVGGIAVMAAVLLFGSGAATFKKKRIDAKGRRRLMERISATGAAKASPGPRAAESQDFLYDDDVLPRSE